jgi:putative ABC transport system substrate-binding protein
MDRREVIKLVGCAAAVSLLGSGAANAQQGERARRVGVLMLYAENDPEGQVRAKAFAQGLEKRGWTVGRNLQIDFHWGAGDADWIRSAAMHMLKSSPDLILANGGLTVRPVQQASRAVPIVFIGGADPVADGLVQSLAHPGGNATGFITLEPSLGAKLLELLKEVAPRVNRAGVLFNPDSPAGARLLDVASAAGRKLAVDVAAIPTRNAADIEAGIAKSGLELNGGLIVLPDPTLNTQRKAIIELADRYRLPALHALRSASAEGGLMSYGVDVPELFRQSASYVDRILRGERPADLPVQQPTKFELVINLKTARALGLAIPQTLLVTADEVIE